MADDQETSPAADPLTRSAEAVGSMLGSATKTVADAAATVTSAAESAAESASSVGSAAGEMASSAIEATAAPRRAVRRTVRRVVKKAQNQAKVTARRVTKAVAAVRKGRAEIEAGRACPQGSARGQEGRAVTAGRRPHRRRAPRGRAEQRRVRRGLGLRPSRCVGQPSRRPRGQ